MPQSLHRTWAALAVAALAVLIVAVFVGGDFVRDVYAPCPGTLREHRQEASEGSPAELDLVAMESLPTRVEPDATGKLRTIHPFIAPTTRGPTFVLAYDEREQVGRFGPREYKNVRLSWKEPGGEAGCTCGAVAVPLFGESPSNLGLYRMRGTNNYVVKFSTGSSYVEDRGVRAAFTLSPGASQRVQLERIVAVRHLPLLVVLLALGALVVALFRSRRAMSYALRINGWTEARLTHGGRIESDTGATLGALEQTRLRQLTPGVILVAPEALSTSGLYRDVPIVARRNVAEGTHARWGAATMVRLRDARALAVISTACALLALGARLIA